MDEQEQLTDVCTELGVTIEATHGAKPALFSDTPMDHWRCKLSLDGRTHETDFWQGIGHRERVCADTRGDAQTPRKSAPPKASEGWIKATPAQAIAMSRPFGNLTVFESEHTWYRPKPPTAADVLSCLLSDAQSAGNARNFEDFASDMGMDTDSRRAEAIYQACLVTFRDMRAFCGEHYGRLASAEH